MSYAVTLTLAVLRFINLFCAGLIAGGQVFVLLVVLPVMRRWPVAMAVRTHQMMLFGTPDKYIVPSAIACPLSAIAILLLRQRLNLSSLFDIIGVLSAAGLTVASVAFAEPLSRRLLECSSEAVPGTYVDVQQRWDRVHAIRTVAALLMMMSFIIATLTT